MKYTTEAIRQTLKEHWLTSIQCDHESRTDRAGCFCGVWYCEPQPSIGEAVDKWIEHLIECLPHEVQTAPITSTEFTYLEDLRKRAIARALEAETQLAEAVDLLEDLLGLVRGSSEKAMAFVEAHPAPRT